MQAEAVLLQIEFVGGGRPPRLRVVLHVAITRLALHVEFADVVIAQAGVGWDRAVGQRCAGDERIHIGEGAHAVPGDTKVRASHVALPIVREFDHEFAETLFDERRVRVVPVVGSCARASKISRARDE